MTTFCIAIYESYLSTGHAKLNQRKNDVRNVHKIPVFQKLSKLLNKKYVKEVFLLWKPQRKMCST